MDDPNAIIPVIVQIVMPTLYCAAGQVDVASLWSPARPQTHLWRSAKPPRRTTWETTQLPGPHSGRF